MVGNDETSGDQAGYKAAGGDEAGRNGVEAGCDEAATRVGPHILSNHFVQYGTGTLRTTMNGIDSIKGWHCESKGTSHT